MEKTILTRSYLETLSSDDLISLADEYGIDIPEGLNRRFIIGELLEVDSSKTADFADLIIDDSFVEASTNLPLSYNETQITVLLRNPAWAFVYWDLNESDCQDLQQSKGFSTFLLRLCYFTERDTEKPHDVFEIPIKFEDREQYLLLSQAEYAVRIDLVAEFKSIAPRVLARSKLIAIPKGCTEISSRVLEEKIPPLLTLSGLALLRRTHYTNHRQSFS